jgi:hypothetical protein
LASGCLSIFNRQSSNGKKLIAQKIPFGVSALFVESFRDHPDGLERRWKVYNWGASFSLDGFKAGKETITMNRISPEHISTLKRELQQVRQQSLKATRQGDFMKVARLTAVAAQLNKSIMDAEGELLAQA